MRKLRSYTHSRRGAIVGPCRFENLEHRLLLSSGERDLMFGNLGEVSYSPPVQVHRVHEAVVSPVDDLLAVATAHDGTKRRLELERFMAANGVRDESFNNTGTAPNLYSFGTPTGSPHTDYESLAGGVRTASGSVYVGGVVQRTTTSRSGNDSRFRVLKLNANGSASGPVELAFNANNASTNARPLASDLLTAGKLLMQRGLDGVERPVVLGDRTPNSSGPSGIYDDQSTFLARFESVGTNAGALDSTFGSGGLFSLPVDAGHGHHSLVDADIAPTVAGTADDMLLAIHHSFAGPGEPSPAVPQLLVRRVSPVGALEPYSGKQHPDPLWPANAQHAAPADSKFVAFMHSPDAALIAMDDGGFVAAGTFLVFDGEPDQFYHGEPILALARFDRDGNSVTTFGAADMSETDFTPKPGYSYVGELGEFASYAEFSLAYDGTALYLTASSAPDGTDHVFKIDPITGELVSAFVEAAGDPVPSGGPGYIAESLSASLTTSVLDQQDRLIVGGTDHGASDQFHLFRYGDGSGGGGGGGGGGGPGEVILDFEELTPGTSTSTDPYVHEGFAVESVDGYNGGVEEHFWVLGTANGYASNVLHPQNWGRNIHVYRTNEGTFALKELQLLDNVYTLIEGDATIVGIKADNSTVVTSYVPTGRQDAPILFGPAWTGLVRVEINLVGGVDDAYLAIDNLLLGVDDGGQEALMAWTSPHRSLFGEKEVSDEDEEGEVSLVA